ncbi:MAG: glycyl-radical enzyme activating protein [Clostridiales bacterium]|nr:glycyl-radical enzyme activating protein [Clostridiales bacterium]
MVNGDVARISAPVFNIQSYSIHDGPGIRTTVFLKGCPLRCLWCANPESRKAAPELMTYASRCTGCGACVEKCPRKVIGMVVEGDRATAVTDRDLCINCGECVDTCRYKAREIAGKPMTVEEVIKRVLRDRIFFEESGGGITVSGGECLLYPEFTEALLGEAKRNGVHTAVETCCFAGRDAVDKVFRYADLGLLDIKHMDSKMHEKYTGVPNKTILDNIKYIYHDLRIPIYIRVPVIPGCNDSEENIADTARFVVEELGADVPIHLLPYHRFGESKNESLGNKDVFKTEVPTKEHMQRLKETAEGFGLKTQIGG